MLGGTAAAQLIPLLAAPVLARLYPPAEFAVFGVFWAVAGTVYVLGTARLELAIVVADRDEVARALATAAVLGSLGVALLAGIVVFVAGGRVSDVLGLPHGSLILAAIPATILLNGLLQALNYWLNRHRAFGALALSGVVQQACMVSVQLLLGALDTGPWGLVAGLLAGQTAAIAWTALRARKAGHPLAPSPWRAARAAVSQFRQFPMFNMPYSLVGNFASGFLVIALSSFGLVTAAGFMAQARRLVLAPVTLLSVSLGQVYFPEAARHFRQPSLERLTIALMLGLASLAAPFYATVVRWAPDLFALALGEPWRGAGDLAVAFLPVAFAFLFTSWPERIYEVAGRQQVALVLQLVADAVGIGVLALALRRGASAVSAVTVYSAVYVSYHVAYLVIVFRIGGFAQRGLLQLGARLALGLGAGWAVAWVGAHLGMGRAAELAFDLVLVAGIAAAGLRAEWQRWLRTGAAAGITASAAPQR